MVKRPSTLFGAGVLSGFMGTVSGIGGPPVALLYQHESGRTLRATLPRYFLVGGAITMVTLVAVGKLGRAELLQAARAGAGNAHRPRRAPRGSPDTSTGALLGRSCWCCRPSPP